MYSYIAIGKTFYTFHEDLQIVTCSMHSAEQDTTVAFAGTRHVMFYPSVDKTFYVYTYS